MHSRVHHIIDSPIGPLTLVAADDGRLAGLFMDRHRHVPPVETFGRRDPAPFHGISAQLAEYFAGRRTEFDLPTTLAGTSFQLAVWHALLDIRYGETVSYAELAKRIGRPGAARAVGLANGRNPISIVVPCHRVVGSGGDLTGYGGGIERKRQLLQLEQGGDLFSAAGMERAPVASDAVAGDAGQLGARDRAIMDIRTVHSEG